MQGGFSIREYASRMRSIDVVKCWPFDETCSEETVKSLLPPIVVKRFTWWLHELEQTAEGLQISEIKSRKVSEKGETSSRNAGADLEDAEEGVKASKLKSSKGKMRATKKRSIVELFAVAPPVMGEEEEDEEEDDGVYCNVGITRASNKTKKKQKNTDAILRKALSVVKKIKRKKAEERRSKEKCRKLKLRTQENSSLTCSKEVDNEINDFASYPKRKPRLQDLGPYKKRLPCTSRLIEENQHPELPRRGILKNRDKEFSVKTSKKRILNEATVELNNCSIQKANKHVSLSENGESLRLSRKASQAVESLKLQKDFASEIGSVAVGKVLSNSETIANEDASTRDELGAGSTFIVDPTTFGKLNFEGEYSNRRSGNTDGSEMYAVNQLCPESSLEDAPRNSVDVYMPSKGYYNGPNMKVTTSSDAPCPLFPPLCFEDYLRTHKDVSMSNMRRAYELTQASPEKTAVDRAYPLHFQAFPHVSPNQVNGGNEEFVGLPLNSQGELIALNSCGKRELHQNMNSNVSGAHCIGHHLEYRNLDRGTSSTSQLNLFPVERSYVKENATIAVLPSKLIIESQSEKANLDSDFLEINYHPFHNSEKTKSGENEKFQSTMRLMGKEFEVGRRGFDNGSVWKDKQITDELHFSPNEPLFWQYTEPLFPPSEISKYALPQTSSTYSSVFLARTVDCGQKLYPRSEVYHTKSLFSEPYSTGYDSQLRNNQNVHYSPIPSVKFPFMHPDFDKPQRSPPIQHPLCFDPSEKAAQLSNHPYGDESVSFQRDDFGKFGPLQSMATAPLPPVPYYSGLLPVSAMQRQQSRIKERIKSRIGNRGIDISKKSKASPLNAPFMPFKMPALGFHEGHQCVVRKMDDAAIESFPATKNPRFVTTKDGVGQILPWPDSFTETARTGPVKMSAGAKHVLKPLHQQDHRPPDTNIGFRFPESENSAEIYQF